MTKQEIKKRLEYLRGELRAERISYGEIAELQSLKDHIDPSDVELLEAAGVPEHEDDCTHDSEGITWDKGPDHKSDFIDAIPWYGKCKCGARVYELYEKQDGIKEV